MIRQILLRACGLASIVLATACGARHALPAGDPDALGMSGAALSRITPFLQAYVDSGKYAGVAALVARNGRVVYRGAVGWSDRERGVPLRDDAIFRIFSMTKPVVAVGAMILVDEGKIGLDDPVAKYIPAFADIKVFAGGSADAPQVRTPDSVMTIRHLLTHTSGLAYGLTAGPVDTIFTRASMYDPASTLAQFADSIARLPLLFTPGTAWSYSSSLEVVGRIIEVVSGMPLDRFLEKRLFEPLGMKDTRFRYDRRQAQRITTLYAYDADGRLAPRDDGLLRMYEPEARFLWASGGLLSTLDDYLRFAQMLLNGGEFNGRRILSEQSVRELMRDQVPRSLFPERRPSTMPRGYSQALGGAILIDSTQTLLPDANGIYRWSGYVGTYFWVDPQNRLIGMVWTQHSPGRVFPLEDEFQALVYQALVK